MNNDANTTDKTLPNLPRKNVNYAEWINILPGAQSVVRPKRTCAKLAVVYISGTWLHTSKCSPVVAIFFLALSRYLRPYKEIVKFKPAVAVKDSYPFITVKKLRTDKFVLSCVVDKVLTSQSSNNSPGGILTQLRRTINVTQRKRVNKLVNKFFTKWNG